MKKIDEQKLQDELNRIKKENAELKAALDKNSGNVLEKQDEQNIRQLFEEYIRMYSSRDDLLTKHFSDNFSGFTGGGDFLVKDKTEWVAITRQDFAQVKDPIQIEIKDLSIQLLTSIIAVTTGFFTIHLPIKDHILSRETARLVLIFRKESEQWKITHSSISIPYHLVREGEIYPMHELVDRNQFLENVITERTSQLSEANDRLQIINKELAKEIAEHEKISNELRISEQKYHLLVDKANEAVVVVQDGFLRLSNPMALTMTGYSADEIGTIPFQLFIHPDDRALVIDNYEKRLRGDDVPSYYIFRLLKKDGNTCWVYMNGVLIDWEGNPATLNFLTDITKRKLAEEALLESNNKLEAIISASPDGIGMITLDGNIQLISDKLVNMHGYSNEKMDNILGRSVFDFIDPSCHKLLFENTRKLIAGDSDRKLTEYLAIRKDNSRFHIDINSSILRDSSGKPVSILYVERDITERKLAEAALQESNQKLEAIISASPDGIGMISLDGKMQLMSDKLLEMYGYSKDKKDDIIGKSASDFIDSSYHEMLKNNIGGLLRGEKENNLSEYLAIKKDNSRFYVELNSTVLHDSKGNPANILFVERDITERKRTELLIQEQYNQLIELNSTKDKFFSIIAHDLRSPFQSLLSSSELLATEIEQLPPEQIISFSKGLNKNLKILHDLLENLLQWSMMQRDMLEYNPVNIKLCDLINQIIEISNQTAKKKNLLISNNVDNESFVYADIDMLRSVIHNLVMNAIKFTPEKGSIVISSSKTESFEKITIQDNGIGIEPDQLSKLFNFNSLTSTHGTAGEKGTGLGLSLCKEFIERNGGVIWVESELGKGSKFIFTLRTTNY